MRPASERHEGVGSPDELIGHASRPSERLKRLGPDARRRKRSPNAASEGAVPHPASRCNQWAGVHRDQELGLRTAVRPFGGPAYLPESPVRRRVYDRSVIDGIAAA
jgi:hypothetical protein